MFSVAQVIKGWLDEKTQKKVNIVRGKKEYGPILAALIDSDQLPKGAWICTLDFPAYAYSSMCKSLYVHIRTRMHAYIHIHANIYRDIHT